MLANVPSASNGNTASEAASEEIDEKSKKDEAEEPQRANYLQLKTQAQLARSGAFCELPQERLGLWKRAVMLRNLAAMTSRAIISSTKLRWQTSEGSTIIGILLSISGVCIVTLVVAVLAWNL